MDGIKDKKYILIKKFFSKDELDFLQNYCKKRIFFGKDCMFTDSQAVFSASFYKDMVMSIYLETKLNKIEEISKLKLFPTYAYWRAYSFNATLQDHTDREACEISVSANIDQCGESWPIHMDGTSIEMEKGDAIMYLGCDILHGRKVFNGVYHSQVFFHYVDQNGPHAKHQYDQITNSILKQKEPN
tara:strand:+ start:2240 stop:2797 length:558 start_codon:yes stop_codon:yes gene_type:complete